MVNYTKQSLESLATHLDVDVLLADIDYRTDTIQESGDKYKCFCPIHKETIFRSLTVERDRKRFRCAYSLCKGSRSGNLLQLWALAKEKDINEAAEYWAEKLNYLLAEEEDREQPAKKEKAVAVEEEKPPPPPTPESPPKQPEPEKKKTKKDIRSTLAQLTKTTEDKKRIGKAAALHAKLPPDAEAPASDILVQAQDLLSHDNLPQAIQLLRDHLRQEPADLQAVQFLANIYIQNGERRNAVDVMHSSLRAGHLTLSSSDMLGLSWKLYELEPESCIALDEMADIYRERKDSEQAIEKWYHSADSWHKQGKHSEAIERLKRILEVAPSESKALEALTKLYVVEKRVPEALDALLRVALVYRDKEMMGHAGDAYQRALKLDKSCIAALLGLGDILTLRGMEAEAVKCLGHACSAHLNAGESDKAIELLQAELKKNADRSGLRERLATILADANRNDDAAEQYCILAEHYTKKELLGKAIEAVDTATKLAPYDPNYRDLLVSLLVKKGDTRSAAHTLLMWVKKHESEEKYPAARELMERVCELQPDNHKYQTRLVELRAQAGDRESGSELLDDLIARAETTKDKGRRKELTQVMEQYWPDQQVLRETVPEAAAETEEAAIEEPIQSAEELIAQANESIAASDLEKAIDILISARDIDPDSVEVLSSLSQCLRQLDRNEEALTILSELVQVYEQLGNREQVFDTLLQAIEIDPGNAKLRLDLVERYSAVGDIDKAIALLDDGPPDSLLLSRKIELLRYQGDIAAARKATSQLARWHCDSGETDKGEAIMRGALDWADDPFAVRMELVELLKDQGSGAAAITELLQLAQDMSQSDQNEKAEKAYREAVELAPDNPQPLQACIDFLSSIPGKESEANALALELVRMYRKEGKAGLARRQLEASLRTQPESAEFLIERIELEVEEGRDQQAATFCLEAAQKIDQTDPAIALELLERATRMAPDQPETWVALVEVCANRELRQQQVDATLQLIGLWDKKGLAGKSLALLENTHRELSEEPKCSPELLITLGNQLLRLHERRGDNQAAAREIDRLATLITDVDGPVAALDLVRRGLQRAPEHIKLRFQEARLMADEGDNKAAAQGFASLASSLFALSTREAEEQSLLDDCLQRTLEIDANHLDALALHGRRLEESGEKEKAKDSYLLACETARQQENMDLAIVHAEAAGRLFPDDADVSLLQAEIYQKRGETHRAALCREKRLGLFDAVYMESPNDENRSVVLEESQALLELEPGRDKVRRRRIDIFREAEDNAALARELFNLLEVQSATGQHQQQVDTYSEIIDLEKDNTDIRHRFAVHLEGLGKQVEAVQQYLILAESLQESQSELAGAHYLRVLQLDPQNERALQAVGKPEVVEEIPSDPLEVASRAIEAGEWSEARGIYLSLAQDNPDDPTPRQQLLKLAMRQGDVNAALAEIEILCPLYEKQGRLLETVEILHSAVKLDPDRWDLHSRLGDHFQRFGNYASAVEEYREAMRLVPRHDHDAVIELCHQLVAVSPGDLDSLRHLEHALTREDSTSAQQAEAESVRLEILRLLVVETPSRKILAEAESLVRRISINSPLGREASSLLARIAMRVSPARAGAHLVFLAVQSSLADDDEQALEEANRAATMTRLYSHDMAILARLFLRLGRHDESLSMSRRLADQLITTSNIDGGLNLLANMVVQWPDNLEQRTDWIEALAKNGRNDQARMETLNLSTYYLERNRRVDAINCCRKAFSIEVEEFNQIWEATANGEVPVKNPFIADDVPALLRLAEIYRSGSRVREEVRIYHLLINHHAQTGQFQQAVAFAQRLLTLSPDDCDAYQQLVGLYEGMGDLPQAIEARIKLARLYLARELPDRAVSAYQDALQRQPDNVDVREELATILSELGRSEESNTELLTVVDRLRTGGNHEDALVKLREFVDNNPSNLVLREALAALYQSLGSEQEAVGQYLEIGNLYRESELTRKAQEAYERALELEPESQASINSLAAVLSDRGKDSEAADLWLRLAGIQSQRGEGQAALEAAEQALASVADYAPAIDLIIEQLEAHQKEGESIDQDRLASACLSRAQREYSGRSLREALQWAEKAQAAQPDSEAASVLAQQITQALSREVPGELLEVRREQLFEMLGRGDISEASELLQSLVEDYPERIDLARQLAQIYVDTGKTDQATQLLLDRGKRRLTAGDSVEAVALLREASGIAPQHEEVSLALAEALMRSGEREAARSLLLEKGRSAIKELSLPIGKADYQTATQWFHKGLEYTADWEDGHLALAELAEKAENHDDARTHLEQLITIYRHGQRVEDALHASQRLLHLLPEPDAEEMKTSLETAREKTRMRLRVLQDQADYLSRLERSESAAQTLIQAAQTAARAELVDLATQLFQNAIELTKDEDLVISALSSQRDLLIGYGNPEAAGQAMWSLVALHERAGRKDEVLETCRRIIEVLPSHGQAHEKLYDMLLTSGSPEAATCGLALAQLYRERDLLGKTEEVYRRLLSAFPGDEKNLPPSFEPLATLYLDKGEEERAIQLCLNQAEESANEKRFQMQVNYLHHILRIREDDLEARRRLPEAYKSLGDMEQAQSERMNLVILYLRRELPLQALDTMREMLRVQPDHQIVLELLYELAGEIELRQPVLESVRGQICEFMEQECAGAVHLLDACEQLTKWDDKLPPLLAQAWAAADDNKKAEKWGLAWIDSLSREDAGARLLDPLRKVQQWLPESKAVANKISTLEQSLSEQREVAHQKSLLESSLLLFAQERWSEATDGYAELLALSPEDKELKLRLAQCRAQMAAGGEEAERLSASQLYFELARQEESDGNNARALQHLECAIELDPSGLETHQARVDFLKGKSYPASMVSEAYGGLAGICLQRGQENRALAALRSALKIDPGNIELLNSCGELLTRKKLPTEARDVYLRIAEREMQSDHVDSAIVAYQRILSISPDDLEALDLLAEACLLKGDAAMSTSYRGKRISLLREQGRLKQVVDEYRQLCKLDDSNAQIYFELSEALFETGQDKDAYATLHQAASKYRERDLIGKAAEIYRRIFDNLPSEREAGIQLAECYSDMGQSETAAHLLLEVGMRSVVAGDMSTAMSHMQQALEYHPRSRSVRRALADLARQMDDQTAAAQWLEQLGQLHRESGAPDRAAQVYEEMMQYAPDCEEACRLLVSCLEETGEDKRRVETQERLGRIYEDRGESDAALEQYLAAADYYMALART
jgi:tetratricopeptide (TPR) repeat protein